MAYSEPAQLTFTDFVRTMRQHPVRWIAPMVTLGVVALLYALTMGSTWQASQAMIVRDEASGGVERPGKFRHVDEMKTLQETILELAKSHSVISAALVEASGSPETTPTDRDVAALQGAIKLSPPKGAEFGKTEMFYLEVKAPTREESIALATAVAKQLQIQCQHLRDERAKSVIEELSRSVELARQDLSHSTERLSDLEKGVGRDLSELRILQESPSGDSQLRRTVTEIENEIRQVGASREASTELLTLLEDAKGTPENILAAPHRLLESQPALRRLKDGLVDAQLRTAQLLGTMEENHPQVVASLAAESEARQSLHREIDVAVQGVEVDLRVAATRLETLQKQLADATARMGRLAAMRAEYANVVAEARHRTEIYRSAEQELAEARASEAGAQTVSLISTVGEPFTGTGPVGPGRSTVVGAGVAGGLLLGLAIVFLTATPAVSRAELVHHTVASDAAAVQTAQQPQSAANFSTPVSAQAVRRDEKGNLTLKEALKKVTVS